MDPGQEVLVQTPFFFVISSRPPLKGGFASCLKLFYRLRPDHKMYKISFPDECEPKPGCEVLTKANKSENSQKQLTQPEMSGKPWQESCRAAECYQSCEVVRS